MLNTTLKPWEDQSFWGHNWTDHPLGDLNKAPVNPASYCYNCGILKGTKDAKRKCDRLLVGN